MSQGRMEQTVRHAMRVKTARRPDVGHPSAYHHACPQGPTAVAAAETSCGRGGVECRLGATADDDVQQMQEANTPSSTSNCACTTRFRSSSCSSAKAMPDSLGLTLRGEPMRPPRRPNQLYIKLGMDSAMSKPFVMRDTAQLSMNYDYTKNRNMQSEFRHGSPIACLCDQASVTRRSTRASPSYS